MRTSLSYLPQNKQKELADIVDAIREKYSVDMIILFGSYARNDWVEELDEDRNYKYQSDFDIFVVTEKNNLASKLEKDAELRKYFRQCLTTPVTIIAHDINFFNRRLRKGQYFFTDIKKEGICLYDSERFELAEAKELTINEYKRFAEEDFEHHFSRANEFLIYFKNASENNNYSIAAFFLHQATEQLYNTVLLVLTRYKPKTHDLEKLGERVASIKPEFMKVFPQGTTEEKRLFELLRDAYVDARYNKNYKITSEELAWLAERVNILQKMIREACQQKIDSLT